MIDVGRVCMKIAGRDAGKLCVVVEVVDGTHVLIDGETRRRKCNVRHLEPLEQVVKISSGADHAKVVDAFKELKISIADRKPKKSAAKPVSKRVAKSAEASKAPPKKTAKGAKKAAKKAVPKKE